MDWIYHALVVLVAMVQLVALPVLKQLDPRTALALLEVASILFQPERYADGLPDAVVRAVSAISEILNPAEEGSHVR